MAKNIVNYLWLDGETTGLDPLKNDIIQLACIPVLNGVEQNVTFNQYCQAINYSEIDPGALAVNGLTVDFIRRQQTAEAMVNNLVVFARNFGVRFTIAGYNVGFDKDFLAALFKKVGREHDFFEIFTGDLRDTMKRAKKLKPQLPTPNIKLATLADHFGIPINAHDALSDISATIQVDAKLSDMLGEVEIFHTDERPLLDVNFPEPAQLHLHSMFSHTDSLNSVNELAEYCSTNNIPGFSAVDHGNAASLFDIIRLEASFKKTNEGIAKANKKDGTNNPLFTNKVIGIPGVGLRLDTGGYLNAWAVSDIGYKNLIKVASIGWNARIDDSNIEFPIVTLEQVIQYKEGIVFGVPGINGPVADKLLSRQIGEAELLLHTLNQNLDIRLELAAVDVYRYFDSSIGFRSYNIPGGNMQKHINQFYLEQAEKLDIKLVPVSDAHFLDEVDKIVQDCVSRNAYKDARYMHESRHILKAREMYSLLRAQLGDVINEQMFSEMITNTHDIMNQAASIKIKHEYHLPKIQIPDDIAAKTDDYNMQTYYYMMRKIKEHGRWNDSDEYKARFKKEVEVIMKNETLNFLPYFLVYEDVCAYARSSGLMQGIARGSAGGSLLSYYLQIIHVDPVAANLPFERFLSNARIRAGSFPDIDLDIADRARPLVMKYLQEKYKLGFAQISTFSKMKTKNAIKDAMYSLYGRNRNDFEIKTLCDSIPDSPQGVDEFDFLYGYIDQEDVEHKGAIQTNELLANFFQDRPEVEQMVKKLIGAIRGWSRHASAFVISTLDLSADRVPTMVFSDKELGEIMVTQFDAGMVEKSGLVKADILGIKTLTMVSDCMDLIEKNHSVNFREVEKGVPYIYRLSDADQGVFTDFYNKDTDSSFQFNTELIKGYAKEFCPLNRADLMSMTALCRPGALDAPLYDTTAAQYFMDVKNRKRTVEYLHQDLEPILADYHGVFVYQEEIMKFLVDIVGYTWEESDLIRSAIAKKKHEVIMNTFTKIRESCHKRGWTDEAIETICQQIMAFSRYSFNKSHSYAYAETGYITLYLKNHYPLEWWTAVLNNEDNNEKVKKYISYLGDLVVAPSLKTPTDAFAIQGGKIVAPISAIKSVGPSVVNELVTKGPFLSLEDYVTRVNHSRVNIGSISALIKARAADDLMDESIEDYAQRRIAFMKKYVSIRKSKTEFKPDMFELDPIKIFLQEREYNLSFNKNLLSDPNIGAILQSKWPALSATKSKSIPYKMVSSEEDREDTYILGSIKTAENSIKNKVDKQFGMILLYEGSNYKTGISKKGRQWHKVALMLSDGYNTLEAVKWDAKKAFGWPKDTIVYVCGEFKEGWKTPVSINITEIDKIE
jgi:DNA polymerase-3 subunit alpha